MLPMGDGLKMTWVDAGSIPAQVVEFEPLRNFSECILVCVTMGAHGMSVYLSELTVAILLQTALPLPAIKG